MFVTALDYDEYEQEQGSLIYHWMLSEIGFDKIQPLDPENHKAIRVN